MLIQTTHGLLDESDLTKREHIIDNGRERSIAVEYYLGSELVHRSARVELKEGQGIGGELAALV